VYISFEPLELRKIFCRDVVKFVNDFVNDDGSFLTLNQFSNKFGFYVIFLQYNGVISSLRQMLKLYPYGDKLSNLQTPFVPSSLQKYKF
jgi:hypothetical protein